MREEGENNILVVSCCINLPKAWVTLYSSAARKEFLIFSQKLLWTEMVYIKVIIIIIIIIIIIVIIILIIIRMA